MTTFAEIDTWGFVNTDTTIVDATTGHRFLVEAQNDSGFRKLRNLSGGEDVAFEVLDQIDHTRFSDEEQ